MRSIFLRPIQLASAALVTLMLASIVILGWLDWRSLDRLRRIQSGVAEIQAIQQTGLEMQQLLIEDMSGVARLDRTRLATAGAELAQLASPQRALAPGTAEKLAQAAGTARTRWPTARRWRGLSGPGRWPIMRPQKRRATCPSEPTCSTSSTRPAPCGA